MSVQLYLAYVLACVVITVIPGPTVTLIAANKPRLARFDTRKVRLKRAAIGDAARRSASNEVVPWLR